MSAGYSYTTLSADRGEPVRVGVSFHLDGSAWLAVAGAGTGAPHLLISQGEVSARVCPCAPGRVTAQDARVARELAGRAAEYAAEIQRLADTHGQGNAGGACPGGTPGGAVS